MKIRIKITFDGPLKLPLANNHILQSYLYSKMSPEIQSSLHDKGYLYGRLPFRLFNFSRLMGDYEINNHYIKFNKFTFQVSSPIESLIQEISNSILLDPGQLAGQPIGVSSIETVPFSQSDVIKMLSPLVIAKNVGRRTEYTSPWDNNFNELINNNLRKKHFLIYDKEYAGEGITLVPTTPYNNQLKQVVKYKNMFHTAWNGQFAVNGDEGLMKVAFDTGIGQKSSQGFGMFEFI